MNVVFANGTNQQQGFTRSAIAFCTFDFDRIDTTVTFEFVNAGVIDNDPNDGRTVFAYTTTGGSDDCGRSNTATIQVLNTLDTLTEGPWSGVTFFMETIIHEIGHVVAGKFDDAARAAISAALGASVESWGNDSLAWEDRASEAWAESFKDVWLPREYRRYDDRTHYRLRDTEDSFAAMLRVMDGLCECTTEVGWPS